MHIYDSAEGFDNMTEDDINVAEGCNEEKLIL